MRPNRLAVPHSESHSFDLRHERLPYFTNPWHFHPELELNFVVSSTGTRFIGQRVQRFGSGEIVLLGPNLPHYWKNDPAFYHPESPQAAEAIVIRFAEDFVGKSFLHLPESRALLALRSRAAGGLHLLEPLRSAVAERMQTLLSLEGWSQLHGLLGLLGLIAESEAVELISPGYVPSPLLTRPDERLNRVMAHLMAHFTEPVSLGAVASLAHLNEAAFCRYFKTRTGQTLTQFVTDLRLRYAADLLQKGEESVTQVGFQSGFESVSHFIQVFKKKHGQTPVAYRREPGLA